MAASDSHPILRLAFSLAKRLSHRKPIRQLKLVILAGLLFLLPSAARAQTTGEPLFERVQAATKRLQSLQADLLIRGIGKFQNISARGSFQVQKPNRGRIEITSTDTSFPIRQYCDGNLLTSFVDKTHYGLEQASNDGDNLIRGTHCNELLYFFEPDELQILWATGKGVQEEGAAVIGGVGCRILRLVGGPEGFTLRLYIGPGDIVYGTDALTQRNGETFGFQSRLSHVKVNPPLRAETFRFAPKKGELAYVSGAPGQAMRTIRRMGKMVEVGATIHDFTLNDLTGKPVTLSKVLQDNKVTALNFWAVNCSPCRIELPLINARLAEWKAKGIGVLTVNLADRAEEVQKIWNEERFSLPVVLRGQNVADQYGVFGIPTTYLLDASGKVLDTLVGVDMQDLQNALNRNLGR